MILTLHSQPAYPTTEYIHTYLPPLHLISNWGTHQTGIEKNLYLKKKRRHGTIISPKPINKQRDRLDLTKVTYNVKKATLIPCSLSPLL